MYSEENKPGVGIVIQNSEGMVLASLSQQLDQAFSPSGIEALAAHRGLQLALKLCFGQVMLEGDAQVPISTIQNEHEVFNSAGFLNEDVRLCSMFFT